jgi:hypothetical protein
MHSENASNALTHAQLWLQAVTSGWQAEAELTHATQPAAVAPASPRAASGTGVELNEVSGTQTSTTAESMTSGPVSAAASGMGIASIVTSAVVPESTGVDGDEELPHPAAIAPPNAEAAAKPRKSRIPRMAKPSSCGAATYARLISQRKPFGR